MNSLEKEIERRLKSGSKRYTIQALKEELYKIGYKLNRDMDCQCNARYLDTGESYPCITTGITHIKSGKSFAYFEAEQDDNFNSLQKLRLSAPIVRVGDRLLEI